jgi:hypothetical protein
MYKKILLVFISYLVVLPVLCQDKAYYLPEKRNFNRAKIGLNNYNRFECKSLLISDDSVSFTDLNTLQSKNLSLVDINYLRVQTGTQTLRWCLYGGLFMGVACLSGIADVASDQNRVLKDNAGTIVVGFIAGGAVAGALIGSFIPKWKTYYIHNKVGYYMPVNYDFYAWKDQVGFSVKMRF